MNFKDLLLINHFFLNLFYSKSTVVYKMFMSILFVLVTIRHKNKTPINIFQSPIAICYLKLTDVVFLHKNQPFRVRNYAAKKVVFCQKDFNYCDKTSKTDNSTKQVLIYNNKCEIALCKFQTTR